MGCGCRDQELSPKGIEAMGKLERELVIEKLIKDRRKLINDNKLIRK